MKNIVLRITTVAIMALAPLMAAAQTASTDPTDSQSLLFQQANVNMAQAGELALAQHAGALVSVGFNDQDGQGVWEVAIAGADGKTWIVTLDAQSGQILGQGLSGLMDDESGGDEGQAENADGGSEADGEDGGQAETTN